MKCIKSFFALTLFSLGCFAVCCSNNSEEKPPLVPYEHIYVDNGNNGQGALWLDSDGKAINAHDGNIIFYQNKYYWFGDHKSAGDYDNGNVHVSKVGIVCYSSDNLRDWTNEGVALPVSQEAGNLIESGCKMERPKVIYNSKTGKFVIWFHLNRKGHGFSDAFCGVAVADQITGPYTFLHAERPNKGAYPVNATDYHKRTDNFPDFVFSGGDFPEGFVIDQGANGNIIGRDFANGQMARDLGLFVDDNQKAYMIYASEENSTLHISLLSDDYLSHTGTYYRIFPGAFNEAPVLFKADGRYFLMASGCTGWTANEARSATASQLFGKWKAAGNPCKGNGGDKTFGGQATASIKVIGAEADRYFILFDVWEPYVYNYDNDAHTMLLPLNFSTQGFEIQWQDKTDVKAL